MESPEIVLRFLIEFDGTDFAGWQTQIKGERTVQGELEAALSQVLQRKVNLIGAGRTDAGVHAAGMVASAKLNAPAIPLEQLMRAVNSLTGGDVQVLRIEGASPDFHARFSALSRSYRYRLECRQHPLRRRIAWTPQHPWDDSLSREASRMILGRHSFRSFCLQRPGETEYLATVFQSDWITDEDGVSYYVTADRFFHKMVRGLVLAFYDVGRGFLSLDDFTAMLLNRPDPARPVRVAPPQGLTLMSVEY